MSRLLGLPNELFWLIADHLDLADLAVFARTSSEAREIARPMLYRNLSIAVQHGLHDLPNADTALYTLLRRPELAVLAKDINFCGSEVGWAKWVIYYYPGKMLSSLDLGIAFQNLVSQHAHLIPASKEEWMRLAKEGDASMSLYLVLCLAKHLKTFSIDSKAAIHLTELARFLQFEPKGPSTDARPSRFLAASKEVELMSSFKVLMPQHNIGDAGKDKSDETMAHFAWWLLFHCPTLETLRLRVYELGRPPAGLQNMEPSNLRSLSFFFTSHACNSLKSLFKHTPKLTRLVYQIGVEISQEPWLPFFLGSDSFSEALRMVAHSLKHLDLSAVYFTPDRRAVYCWPSEDSLITVFGNEPHDFSFLRHLKTLRVPIVELLGWEASDCGCPVLMSSILPPSLKSLTLTDVASLSYKDQWNSSALLKILTPYVRNVKGEPRPLEHFGLEVLKAENEWSAIAKMQLTVLCSGAGLTCYIWEKRKRLDGDTWEDALHEGRKYGHDGYY